MLNDCLGDEEFYLNRKSSFCCCCKNSYRFIPIFSSLHLSKETNQINFFDKKYHAVLLFFDVKSDYRFEQMKTIVSRIKTEISQNNEYQKETRLILVGDLTSE